MNTEQTSKKSFTYNPSINSVWVTVSRKITKSRSEATAGVKKGVLKMLQYT